MQKYGLKGRIEDYSFFFGGGGGVRQLFADKNIVASAWSDRTVLHF